jgi:hypothetical protein
MTLAAMDLTGQDLRHQFGRKYWKYGLKVEAGVVGQRLEDQADCFAHRGCANLKRSNQKVNLKKHVRTVNRLDLMHLIRWSPCIEFE